MKSQAADDTGNHEVILTITVTAKQDAFLVEIQQADFLRIGYRRRAVASDFGDSGSQYSVPLRS